MSWHHFDRGHSHKSRQSPALCCDTAEIWPGFGVVAHPLPATTNRANTQKMAEEVAFLCSALGSCVVTGWYKLKGTLGLMPKLMYNASNAHSETSPMVHITHLGIKGEQCQGY